MFDTWSTRGALAATTALAALGLVMIVPQFAQPPLGGLTGTPRLVQEEAPATALPAPAPSVAPSPSPAPEAADLAAEGLQTLLEAPSSRATQWTRQGSPGLRAG